MSFGIVATVATGIGGSLLAARGAKKAASAQQDAANQQLALQREQYEQSRQDQAPFRTVGTNALNELALRLGLGGYGGAVGGQGGGMATQALAGGNLVDFSNGIPIPNQELYNNNEAYRRAWDTGLQGHIQNFGGGYRADSDGDAIDQYLRRTLQSQADQESAAAGRPQDNPLYGSLLKSFSTQDFETDPGYQFRLGEGQRQIEGSAAARGGLLSGAAAKALTKYNQNFASNEYGNAFNRFNTEQTNQFNRLANLAGVGQQATNATQQANQNFATSGSNAIGQIGQARASGYAGQANALAGGLGSIGAGFGNYLGGSGFGGFGGFGGGGSSAYTTPVVDNYTGVVGRPLP